MYVRGRVLLDGLNHNVLLYTPGCTIDIHFVPPGLKNKGRAKAALLMIGSHGGSERGVGNMTGSAWTGNDGINIPFYGSQWLWQFYLHVCLLYSL